MFVLVWTYRLDVRIPGYRPVGAAVANRWPVKVTSQTRLTRAGAVSGFPNSIQARGIIYSDTNKKRRQRVILIVDLDAEAADAFVETAVCRSILPTGVWQVSGVKHQVSQLSPTTKGASAFLGANFPPDHLHNRILFFCFFFPQSRVSGTLALAIE